MSQEIRSLGQIYKDILREDKDKPVLNRKTSLKNIFTKGGGTNDKPLINRKYKKQPALADIIYNKYFK